MGNLMWTFVALAHFILAGLALLAGHDAADAMQIALLCMLMAKAYE